MLNQAFNNGALKMLRCFFLLSGRPTMMGRRNKNKKNGKNGIALRLYSPGVSTRIAIPCFGWGFDLKSPLSWRL